VIGLYAVAHGAPRVATGAQEEPLRVLAAAAPLELVCGAAPPDLSAEALRAHEAAVRRIAGACEACLPARFGAGAAGEEELVAWARAHAAELEEALRLVRGREQMTVRVLGSAAPDPGEGGPGTRYLEARRRAQRAPELDPLRSALSQVVRAERVERHEEPGLLASVYHLIDRGAAPRYRELVERSSIEGVRLAVSGPWPAWSFAPELSP